MPHPLEPLFAPQRIAVFGASDRPESVGGQILRNLNDGFEGDVFALNPKYEAVAGQACYRAIKDVPARVDLAVVAVKATAAPGILRECGAAGVRAAIVVATGFSDGGPTGRALERELVREAEQWNIQLLGPSCLGLISTPAHMNATFSAIGAKPGSLALISQSGALCTAILDWATDLPIGFSSVVSIGDAASVGFGEVLDYLATDKHTAAILLHVEGVKNARRFMSGLRAAARLKPTVVLKAGHSKAAQAAQSHSGVIVGSDDVFDAALRRAGAVRVRSITQLFATAQLLAGGHRARGDCLAVVTNASGPAIMALDRAAEVGIGVADLEPETSSRLQSALPQPWSEQNPVDMRGEAGPSHYREAVSACMADKQVHGLLVILTPQFRTLPSECAQALVDVVSKGRKKPVLACWMGGGKVEPGREILRRYGIPTFSNPEAAVDAFRDLRAYNHNQRLLLQVPTPLTFQANHDVDGARLIIETVLSEGRRVLDTLESKAVLRAFGISCTMPIRARTATEALLVGENLGFPVVLKIDSPDISHKTDVEGVRLGLSDGRQVRHAFASLMAAAARLAPDARVVGATVERMHDSKESREVMVGVARDQSFGPAITVGAGGVMVEVFGDHAIGLPPLNSFIARDLLGRTALSRALGTWRGRPAADVRAIEEVLLRVSDLVCELPEVVELDINPLSVDANGAVALDARLVVAPAVATSRAYGHMAMHPYPAELQLRQELPDGSEILIRPIRPEDAEAEQRFVRGLSERSKYYRFMQTLNELTPEMLVRFTQIDYDREMAFVATRESENGPEQVGVSRYVTNKDGTSCEFALVVADAWQHKGVGRRLMKALLQTACERGLATMVGDVHVSNSGMLRLVQGLGFVIAESNGDDLVQVRKNL